MLTALQSARLTTWAGDRADRGPQRPESIGFREPPTPDRPEPSADLSPSCQVRNQYADIQTIGRIGLSRLLNVSPSTLDRMRVEGTFPLAPVSLLGWPRWSRALVARWLGGDPSMPDDDYTLLTLTEVAHRLSVSRATAYRLRGNPALRELELRVGKEARYPSCRIRNLLRER